MAVQTNTFKGARYVPKFADPIEWSADNSYEAIESVQHNGFTYLSKQPVPVGVEITNTKFWLEWADPNAQMEQLRQEVNSYVDTVNEISVKLPAKATAFDTVNAMKNSENLELGEICHTSGFHESGDGGAAWYKITDLGTPNDKDVIACGNLVARLIVTQPIVNVLALGAKNDGTEDCSAIVNAMTSKYNLHFPPGSYNVGDTLRIVKNISGNEYRRLQYGWNGSQNAILKSSIDGDAPVISISSNPANVHDIEIECNDVNTAIEVKQRAYLKDICICNLANIGINVIPVSGKSRTIYANNISIEGATGYPASIGIYCNKYCYDSKFENLEIMRVQKGIVLYTQAIFNNVHLWGGTYEQAEQPEDSWKSGSFGIELFDDNNSIPRFIGSNVYIDTFHYFIRAHSANAIAEINNLIALSDSTITWGSTYNNALIYAEGLRAHLKVNGGYIRYNDYFHLIKAFTESTIVNINNVTFSENRTSIQSSRNRYTYPLCDKFFNYLPVTEHAGRYTPVAVLQMVNNGISNVRIGLYEQYIDLQVKILSISSTPNIEVTVLSHNGAVGTSLYYYYDGCYLYIYALSAVSTTSAWPLNVEIEDNSNAYLIDATSIIGNLYTAFYGSISSLPSGAVEITY